MEQKLLSEELQVHELIKQLRESTSEQFKDSFVTLGHHIVKRFR